MRKLIFPIIAFFMFVSTGWGASTKLSDLTEQEERPSKTSEFYINKDGTSKKIGYDNLMDFLGTVYRLSDEDFDDLKDAADTLNDLDADCALVLDEAENMDEHVSFDKEVMIVPTPGNRIDRGPYNLTINSLAETGPFYWIDDTDPTGTLTFGINDVYAAWWGLNTSASGSVNAAAIQSAMESYTTTIGGKVKLHRGSFTVAPDVIDFDGLRHITLSGACPVYGYDEPFGATVLSFSAGTVGISMYDATGGVAGQGNRVMDLAITGNDVLDYGIKLNDNHVVDSVSIRECDEYAFWLADYTNSAVLDKVSAHHNRGDDGGAGIGLYINGQNTTRFTVKDSNFRDNEIGIKQEAGQGFVFDRVVIESNFAEGLYINRLDAATPLYLGEYRSMWIENNYKDGAGYGLLITATTPGSGATTPNWLTFHNCTISATVNARHISIEAARDVKFINSTVSGGDVANSTLLNSSYALNCYYIGGQSRPPQATGREWSTLPTSFVPGGANPIATPLNSKTFQLAKIVDQAQSAGPTTIFTVSSLSNGSGMFQVGLAGTFAGQDVGARLYWGFFNRTGGTVAPIILPVRIAPAAFNMTMPSGSPVTGTRNDLTTNALQETEDEFNDTDYKAGSYATITVADSSGDLLIRLTLGDWAGAANFTGIMDITLTCTDSDICLN